MYIKSRKKTDEEKALDGIEREKMWDFFNSLWVKMRGIRRCRNCGKQIWGENLSIYWDHLLPKELYPQFKYEEENMFFCCGECHTNKSIGFPGKKHKIAIEEAKQKFLYGKNN